MISKMGTSETVIGWGSLQPRAEKSEDTAQTSSHQVATSGPTAVSQVAVVLAAGGKMVVLAETTCKVGKTHSKGCYLPIISYG
jgi:hypothetical protein